MIGSFCRGGLLPPTISIIVLLLLMNLKAYATNQPDTISKGDSSDIIIKAKQLLDEGRFDSALVIYQSALNSLTRSENWNSVVGVLVDMAEVKRQKNERDSAFYLLGRALYIYDEKNIYDNELQADIFHRKGITLIDAGDYLQAESYLHKSIHQRGLASKQPSAALSFSYNGLGVIHLRRHNYDSALWNYRKALEIKKSHDPSMDLDITVIFQNIGIAHASMGNFDSAYTYMSKALQIHENVLPATDPRMARIYLNTGRQMQLSGFSEKALQYYELAEKILASGKEPDDILTGVLMLNKANVFSDLSDYDKALIYSTKALNIFTRHYQLNHARVLLSYLTIGHVYERRHEFHNAIAYYSKGISETQSLASDIKVFRNLANCYLQLDNYEEAGYYFRKALELSRAIFRESHPETALSYLNYARFLAGNRQFGEALSLLGRAETILLHTFGAKNRDLSNVYFSKGLVLFDSGKISGALEYFQRAIIAIVPGFNSMNIYDNPSTEQLVPDQFLLNALYYKAMALHLTHKAYENGQLLGVSLETYLLATELINRLRASYISQESKLIITAVASEIYPHALECALDLYNFTGNRKYLELLFAFSEGGKAALLHAALQEMEARQTARVPASVTEQERQLRRSLDSYNKLIFEETSLPDPNERKIGTWQEKVFHLNRRYDSLVQAIDRLYPEFYELRFGSPLITLDEVQHSLGHNDVLISYTFGTNKLFILGITSDSVAVRIVAPVEDLHNNLYLMRQHLVKPQLEHFSLSRFREFASLSNQLYSVLLGGMERLIANRRLIIIPDHQLGYIPFEVLTTHYHESNSMDFRQLPYLVLRQPVSYTYSASLLFDEQHDRRGNSHRILAFAPDYEITNFTNQPQRNELLPLPFALEEVRSITRLFSGRSFRGESATEENFKHKASGYGVLHLAMHAFIDNENPLYSRLVFSSSPDTIEDGMLNTYELFNLDLSADLAVLSACQTGDGRLHRGEGVMSLARGFFYAGVPSIVMTLWAVDDASSSTLVTSFYRYLFRGKSKDEALRYAKLDYIKHSSSLNAHPYFWAGFVNIGDTQPVLLRRNHARTMILLSLAIAAAIAATLVIVKRRH